VTEVLITGVSFKHGGQSLFLSGDAFSSNTAGDDDDDDDMVWSPTGHEDTCSWMVLPLQLILSLLVVVGEIRLLLLLPLCTSVLLGSRGDSSISNVSVRMTSPRSDDGDSISLSWASADSW